MIWRLVKLDPAWRMTLGLSVTAALAGIFPGARAAAGPLAMTVLMTALLSTQPRRRATMLFAALPIPARTLFLARAVTVLTMLWLPACVAMGSLLVTDRGLAVAGTIGEAALILTLIAVIQLSLDPRLLAAEPRKALAYGVVSFAAAVLVLGRVPAALVCAICALASLLVFGRTLAAIPSSFQTAPLESQATSAARSGSRSPGIVWWPLARAMFRPLSFGFVPVIVFQTGRLWGLNSMMAVFPAVASLSRLQWALTLPLRRRSLLGLILAVWTIPPIAGCFVRLLLRSREDPALRDPGFVFLTAAVIACLFLLEVNVVLAGMHHRYRRFPAGLRWAGCALAGAFFVQLVRTMDSMDGWILRLRAGLPFAAGLAGSAATLSVLWWAAARLFDGAEIPKAAPAAVGDSIMKS